MKERYESDFDRLNSDMSTISTDLSSLKELSETKVFQSIDAFQMQLSALGELSDQQLNEAKVASDRHRARLREEMELLREKIMSEMEPVIDQRAQNIVSGLFSKVGGGTTSGPLPRRGLGGGQMSKSTAIAPTLQRSLRLDGGSRTESPDLDNNTNHYYGRSSGLRTPDEDEFGVRREIDVIFEDYDEQAQDKLIDVDGLKIAIKRGLMTVCKNAHENDD